MICLLCLLCCLRGHCCSIIESITVNPVPGQLETQCSIWTGWPDGFSVLAGWSFPIAVSGWSAHCYPSGFPGHLDFQSIWISSPSGPNQTKSDQIQPKSAKVVMLKFGDVSFDLGFERGRMSASGYVAKMGMLRLNIGSGMLSIGRGP